MDTASQLQVLHPHFCKIYIYIYIVCSILHHDMLDRRTCLAADNVKTCRTTLWWHILLQNYWNKLFQLGLDLRTKRLWMLPDRLATQVINSMGHSFSKKKVSVMAGNRGSLLQHWATQKHKVQHILKRAISKCWIKTNHLPKVNIEERFFQDHCNSLHRSSPHMAKPRLRNQGWLEELLVKRWEQKLPGVSGKNPRST